jgi:hypothetical protein
LKGGAKNSFIVQGNTQSWGIGETNVKVGNNTKLKKQQKLMNYKEMVYEAEDNFIEAGDYLVRLNFKIP